MINIELLIPNKKLFDLIKDDPKYKKDILIQINKTDVSYTITQNLFFLSKNNKYIIDSINHK